MKLKKLFEDDSKAETQPRGRTETQTRARAETQSRYGHDKEDDEGRLTTGLVGSPVYMAPERLRAAGIRGKGKLPEMPEPFGKPPVATEKDPLPPFPYHPKQNAVKDPEAQIYYTLKAEGPLHWRTIQSKIAPYLKQLTSTDRDVPPQEDYVTAVLGLLKRGVIGKTDGGKYVVR